MVYKPKKMAILFTSDAAMARVRGLVSDESAIRGCSPSSYIEDAIIRTHARSRQAADVTDMIYVAGGSVSRALSAVFGAFVDGNLDRTRSEGLVGFAADFAFECVLDVDTSDPRASRLRSKWGSVVERLSASHEGAGYERDLARELAPELATASPLPYIHVIQKRLDDLLSLTAAWEFLQDLFSLARQQGEDECIGAYGVGKRPESPRDRLGLIDLVSSISEDVAPLSWSREVKNASRGPAVTHTLSDGRRVRYPSSWITLNPKEAKSSASVLVVETKNGGNVITEDGQGTPHFVKFLAQGRPCDLTNDDLASIDEEICEVWPAFREVLAQRSEDDGLDGKPLPGYFDLLSVPGYLVEEGDSR